MTENLVPESNEQKESPIEKLSNRLVKELYKKFHTSKHHNAKKVSDRKKKIRRLMAVKSQRINSRKGK